MDFLALAGGYVLYRYIKWGRDPKHAPLKEAAKEWIVPGFALLGAAFLVYTFFI